MNTLLTEQDSLLPTISLRSRSYDVQFTAYVNAYVVSEHRQWMKQGFHNWYSLWYLSLVAARGQGTTLQALYSALVNNSPKEISLEGIGNVALGNKREDLIDAGYSTHWNYEQAEIVLPGGGRALHGILEP